MEESSERRRERLRALREEASVTSNDEEAGGACVAVCPDPSGLPFPGDLRQVSYPASPSPSPSPRSRFEFYTDPLGAFSGSQKKKPKYRVGSSSGGGPASLPCKSPPSPFLQPDSIPDFRPPGYVNSPGLHSLGSFNTPGSPSPLSNPYQHSTGNVPSPDAAFFISNQSSTSGKFTHPASFSTRGLTGFNPDMVSQDGYICSGSSSVNPHSGFGSPQPFSASHLYNGSVGGSLNTPVSNQLNQERGGVSTGSPYQHRSGGVNCGQRSDGWIQNSMSSGLSLGSNRWWGSSKQSPGSSGRGNRTPGRSGGRGMQRASHDTSAITNPELFAKRSMLLDPWKDLIPVLYESVASRLHECSAADSRDWLPKSASKATASPCPRKGVTIASCGPSLAESLAASYADAVLGEDGA